MHCLFYIDRVMILPHNRNSSACLLLAALACADSLVLLFVLHKWTIGRITYRYVLEHVGRDAVLLKYNLLFLFNFVIYLVKILIKLKCHSFIVSLLFPNKFPAMDLILYDLKKSKKNSGGFYC